MFGKLKRKRHIISISTAFIFIIIMVSVVLFAVKKQNEMTWKILIVGDSIGEGAGASDPTLKWYKYLIPYMKDTYGIKLDITNVSMGGNTSYAGYARVMMLEEKEEYDIVIVCYGENDKEEDFSICYESILYAINHKYPSCGIITILESSQKGYTGKIKKIQDLSRHYDAYVADTVKAFEECGRAYEELCDDGTHPNDEGQKLYYETVREILDEMVLHEDIKKNPLITAVNKEMEDFENFRYYSAEDFDKTDGYTYSLKTTAPLARLGLDYWCVKGDNQISVYADGQNICEKQYVWNNNFTLRFIEIAAEECMVESEIQIVFSSEAQMKAFEGMIINDQK